MFPHFWVYAVESFIRLVRLEVQESVFRTMVETQVLYCSCGLSCNLEICHSYT